MAHRREYSFPRPVPVDRMHRYFRPAATRRGEACAGGGHAPADSVGDSRLRDQCVERNDVPAYRTGPVHLQPVVSSQVPVHHDRRPECRHVLPLQLSPDLRCERVAQSTATRQGHRRDLADCLGQRHHLRTHADVLPPGPMSWSAALAAAAVCACLGKRSLCDAAVRRMDVAELIARRQSSTGLRMAGAILWTPRRSVRHHT